MYPTQVFVIVTKDREGKPRGFEKVINSRFYINKIDADRELCFLDNDSYEVVPCVIMSQDEYYKEPKNG